MASNEFTPNRTLDLFPEMLQTSSLFPDHSEERLLKVSYRPEGFIPPHRRNVDAAPRPVPLLRLTGRWLDEAGFPPNTAVRVRVERGRLIIDSLGSA